MFGGERYGKRSPNERERRVIELVAQGLKNCEVAVAIGTTEHVVKNYLRTIYDKLGLWNRVELALWYEARRKVKHDSRTDKSSKLSVNKRLDGTSFGRNKISFCQIRMQMKRQKRHRPRSESLRAESVGTKSDKPTFRLTLHRSGQ